MLESGEELWQIFGQRRDVSTYCHTAFSQFAWNDRKILTSVWILDDLGYPVYLLTQMS